MAVCFVRLEAVVNRMFERCFSDRQYTQAIGISIETRRLDILERAITEAVSYWTTLLNSTYKFLLHLAELEVEEN